MGLKYREKYRFGAFYSGVTRGDTAYCNQTKRLFCLFGDAVTVIDRTTGQKIDEISLNGDLVSAIALSPDCNILVIATKQGLLKQYATNGLRLERTWGSIHNGPVRLLCFDPTSTFLASGGSDGSVKVWDVIRKFCTHNLKNHTGLIQSMRFHPTDLSLLVSCDDHTIKRWQLTISEVANVYDSHVSTVTAIAFIDNETVVSAGRDSVLLFWKLDSTEPYQTIAVYEPVEDLTIREGHIFTVGVRGQLRKWTISGDEVATEAGRRTVTPETPDLNGYHSIHNASDCLIVIDNIQNIHFLTDEIDSLRRQTTLNGNMEEVLSTCWVSLKDQVHFAAATNSPIIQIRQLESGHSRLLEGHTGAVLAIDCHEDESTLVSCSRDNTIKLWTQVEDNYKVAVTLTGHAAAVTCVKFLHKSMSILSCSEDKTVKLWDYSDNTFSCRWTQFDHDKSVNGVAIAPNDKLVASAGADKMCILYRTKDGAKVGTFEGHKKGVWTCAFSPTDQIMATGSADGDIRLWALKDQTCIKALEGSDCSVLDLVWAGDGQNIISCGSDGVIRIWDLATAIATEVIEAHSERCWAITANKDLSMVLSCGADAQIVCWLDVTEEEREAEQQKMIEEAAAIQNMENMIQSKNYSKALTFALRLGRPSAALNALCSMSSEQHKATVSTLSSINKHKLLEFCAKWNRNSKTAYSAQLTIHAILSSMPLEELLNDFGMRKQLESLLPFTDRYRRKIDNLRIQSRFANFAISAVKVAPNYIENDIE